MKNVKYYMEQKDFKAYDIKNINTRNLIIPKSQVYELTDFPCGSYDFN